MLSDFKSWLRKSRRKAVTAAVGLRPPLAFGRVQLTLDYLEDRCVPAATVVDFDPYPAGAGSFGGLTFSPGLAEIPSFGQEFAFYSGPPNTQSIAKQGGADFKLVSIDMKERPSVTGTLTVTAFNSSFQQVQTRNITLTPGVANYTFNWDNIAEVRFSGAGIGFRFLTYDVATPIVPPPPPPPPPANVTPSNVSLTPSPGSINEGSSTTVSGSFADSNAGDTHTVSINWGDGSPNSTVNLGAGVLSFSGVNHQYADNGSYTITATVTDPSNASGQGTSGLTVSNVAPTATLSTNSGITFGNAATASLSSPFDPSSVDTTAGFRYAFSIDTDTTGFATYNTSGTGSFANFGPIGAGPHTVYARILDKNNSSTPYSTTLTVNKASSSTSVVANSKTFDGNAFTITSVAATGAGGLNDTNPSNFGFVFLGTGSTVYSSAIAPTNAGTYTVTATYNGGPNHNGSSSAAMPFSIFKANALISVSPYSVTYDGTQKSSTGTAKGVGGVNLSGLDLTGTTHTNAGTYNGDTWTFTDMTGNYNNNSGTVNNAIAKADANITVNGYSTTYDANARTATGTVTGALGESLTGLDLSASNHTNAGSYIDPWTFTDATGNYKNASGTVNNSIAKANANITVNGYSVIFDGTPYTATGSATGVLGESLAGLNLSATTHTNAGTYNGDAWTFTDVTGNYNNANGTVDDAIAKAPSTTTITVKGGAYTGGKFGVTSVLATGAGGLNVTDINQFSVLYSGTGTTVYNSSTAPTKEGTYSVVVTYPGDANHTGSNSGVYAFTIGPRLIAVVRSNGSSSNSIEWIDPKTGTVKWTSPVPTYGNGLSFGAPSVAVVNDRNNDGYSELFIGSQVGKATQLGLVDGKTGALLWSTNPFYNGFTGGVNVAAGDLTGDGSEEVVVAPVSGQPNVRAFQQTAPGVFTFSMVRDFYAYVTSYTGGVNIAVADVNKDNLGDIVTGTANSSDNVRVFSSGQGTSKIADFFAFNRTGVIPGYAGGVSVAAGDLNTDGYADLVVGTLKNASRVRVYAGGVNAGLANTPNAVLQDYTTASTKNGVLVMAADFGDGKVSVGTLTYLDSTVVLSTWDATSGKSILTKSYARPVVNTPPVKIG